MSYKMKMDLDEGQSIVIASGMSDTLRKNPLKIGTIVTYKYNDITKNGKPKYARFWRVKNYLN